MFALCVIEDSLEMINSSLIIELTLERNLTCVTCAIEDTVKVTNSLYINGRTRERNHMCVLCVIKGSLEMVNSLFTSARTHTKKTLIRVTCVIKHSFELIILRGIDESVLRRTGCQTFRFSRITSVVR